FLLLSVSRQFLEGFDNQGRGRRYHFNLNISVLNGQFHSHPRALPITGSLGNLITNHFSRQTQWGQSLGPRHMWHKLPH
ncbi:unnamed protein product, partial [Gulo gulo]